MKEADHSERGHSKISPSKMKNLETCPRYTSDDHSDPHPMTLSGTRCHEAMETGNDEHLDDEEKALVKKTRDYDGMFAANFPDVQDEVRLSILAGIWGFGDRFRFNADKTRITYLDWKFGRRAQPDAEFNIAAQAYVYGSFLKWQTVQEISVHYVYPRRDEVSVAVYTRNDVPRILKRMTSIVDRVKSATDLDLVPDEDNCTYCGSKATCPALINQIVVPVAEAYNARKQEMLPDIRDPDAITTPSDMGKALIVASLMEKWVGSVKHHAQRMAVEEGIEIPGYELKTRAGRKKIVNATLAYEVAAEMGVDQNDFLAAVDVNAKRLVDAVREKAKRGKKKGAEQQLLDNLENIGVLERGGDSFYLGRTTK